MFMIYPYSQNSAGAIGIAEELDGKRILRDASRSTYKQKDGDIVINWGDGYCPNRFPKALNAQIMDVINKTAFFKRLNGTGLTPPFALSKGAAILLGYPIFCRTTVEGQDGSGIVVADKEEQLVHAGLYVKGIDKTSEYRVHVGRYPDGQLVVIGGNQKGLKTGNDAPPDPRVWTGSGTYLGDWMEPAELPQPVVVVAVATMAHFPELTFVGLDIIYDNSEGKAYVLEGNSAPMMTAMTVFHYGKFFKEYESRLAKPQVSVQPTPVPVPVLAESSPVKTFETVVDDLNHERVSLKDIIQCYIQHN